MINKLSSEGKKKDVCREGMIRNKKNLASADSKDEMLIQWNTNTIFPVLHWLGALVISFLLLLRIAWHMFFEQSLLAATGRLIQCLCGLANNIMCIYALRFELSKNSKENKATRGQFFVLLHIIRGTFSMLSSFQPLCSPGSDKACNIPDIDISLMMTYYQMTDIIGLAPSGLMMKISMLELPWHMWLDYRYASLNLIAGSNTLLSFMKTRGLRLTVIRLMTNALPLILDSSNAYRQEGQLVVFLLSGALMFKTALQIGIQFTYGNMNESSFEVLSNVLAMFFFMSADYGSMLKLAHHKLEDLSTALSHTFQKKREEEIIQEVKDIANLVNAGAQEGGGSGGRGEGGDRLELLHSIGGGAHGTVFKGRWKGMEVAVKTVIFPYEHGSDKSARQRAVLEAGVSCSVVHPNIVTTFHWDIKAVHTSTSDQSSIHGKESKVMSSSSKHSFSLDPSLEARDWKLYLVQELCHASLESIHEAGLFVIQHGPSKGQPLLLTILGALLDVAKGLEYLHHKAIIHGDLKPENILAKTDPDKPHGFTCKITDFGLSAMMDPNKTHVSNFRHGTPFYMAPEIFSGQTTTASDVFSYGMLMTELYTGLQPWIFEDGQFKHNRMFIAKLDKEAPSPFKKLVHGCLQINPKERPSFVVITVSIQGMMDEEISQVMSRERRGTSN